MLCSFLVVAFCFVSLSISFPLSLDDTLAFTDFFSSFLAESEDTQNIPNIGLGSAVQMTPYRDQLDMPQYNFPVEDFSQNSVFYSNISAVSHEESGLNNECPPMVNTDLPESAPAEPELFLNLTAYQFHSAMQAASCAADNELQITKKKNATPVTKQTKKKPSSVKVLKEKKNTGHSRTRATKVCIEKDDSESRLNKSIAHVLKKINPFMDAEDKTYTAGTRYRFRRVHLFVQMAGIARAVMIFGKRSCSEIGDMNAQISFKSFEADTIMDDYNSKPVEDDQLCYSDMKAMMMVVNQYMPKYYNCLSKETPKSCILDLLEKKFENEFELLVQEELNKSEK